MEETKNKSLQVTALKEKRKAIEALELKYARINLAREEILSKMEDIQNSCKHEIVVKTATSDIQDTYFDEAICLICNQRYSSPGIWTFDEQFKNLIYFNDEKFNDITEEEKVEIALNLFYEEKEKNPELSDSKIVEIINERLKSEKDYKDAKVLTNKPDLKN